MGITQRGRNAYQYKARLVRAAMQLHSQAYDQMELRPFLSHVCVARYLRTPNVQNYGKGERAASIRRLRTYKHPQIYWLITQIRFTVCWRFFFTDKEQ